MKMDRLHRRSAGPTRRRRSGAATLWVLISLPALLIVLLIVVDVGNIWVARTELENALEASALAAVREWGATAPPPAMNATNPARARGFTLAAANQVRGQALAIAMNQGTYDVTTNPNENGMCETVIGPPAAGNLVFGAISLDGMGLVTLDASNAPVDLYGVRAQASLKVASLAGSFLGISNGAYAVSAKATAMYDATGGTTRLVRVDQFICGPGAGAD